jgi:hypothetical protein
MGRPGAIGTIRPDRERGCFICPSPRPSTKKSGQMATKQQVERKLNELIRRLDESGGDVRGSLAESLPEPRVIHVIVPDLDAAYWTEMSDGRMGALRKGAPGRADIRVEVAGDDLVDLVDGRKSLFSSYLAGHVKIEASLSDLLRLRKLA